MASRWYGYRTTRYLNGFLVSKEVYFRVLGILLFRVKTLWWRWEMVWRDGLATSDEYPHLGIKKTIGWKLRRTMNGE